VTFQLLDLEDIRKVMGEAIAQVEVDITEELPAWGVEPEAFYAMADFMIRHAIEGLRVTNDPHRILGSLLYTGFTMGTKIAMEVEMRRMAETADSQA
jgi:hypothetical protein